jgi:hypothetical protein
MNDLIVKIAKVDPLYAEEYFKIRGNWSHSQSSLPSFLFTQLSFFAFYINAIKAEHTLPFLAVAPSPFIQEPNQKDTRWSLISCGCFWITLAPKEQASEGGSCRSDPTLHTS